MLSSVDVRELGEDKENVLGSKSDSWDNSRRFM
jgi:hypothetical protein